MYKLLCVMVMILSLYNDNYSKVFICSGKNERDSLQISVTVGNLKSRMKILVNFDNVLAETDTIHIKLHHPKAIKDTVYHWSLNNAINTSYSKDLLDYLVIDKEGLSNSTLKIDIQLKSNFNNACSPILSIPSEKFELTIAEPKTKSIADAMVVLCKKTDQYKPCNFDTCNNPDTLSWNESNNSSPPDMFKCSFIGDSSLSSANRNAKAGDTVLLEKGSYKSSIAPVSSGNSNKFITYKGISDSVSITNTYYGIYLHGKSFIKISGIHFHDVSKWAHVVNDSNIEISNCVFSYADFPESFFSIDSSTNARIINCHFEDSGNHNLLDISYCNHITIANCYFLYGAIQCLLNNSKFNILHGNHFDKINDNGFFYIHLTSNSDSNRIEQNQFGCMDALTRDILILSESHYNTIIKNVFVNSFGIALQVDNSTNNLICNNTIYLTNGYGFDITSSSKNIIVNNLILKSKGIHIYNFSAENRICNNLIVADSNFLVSQPDQNEIKNNKMFTDINGVSFVDINKRDSSYPCLPDLRLKPNSPCIDNGINIDTQLKDRGIKPYEYCGQNWDIGAYEFTGPQQSVGIKKKRYDK